MQLLPLYPRSQKGLMVVLYPDNGAYCEIHSFFNNKGGVGETTLATNVASYLSGLGKRILLIDLDPQCNSTQALYPDEFCQEVYFKKSTNTIYDYIAPIDEGGADLDKSCHPTHKSNTRFNVDAILGHPNLSIFEDNLSESWSGAISGTVGGLRVTNWCNQLLNIYQDEYDIAIFDAGPSLGALNRSILIAADFILTPLGCDIFSILGISNIANWIQSWTKKYNNGLNLAKQDHPEVTERYPIIINLETKHRLIGFTIQQYVKRKFKADYRPVKAYDAIMQEMPNSINANLKFIMPRGIDLNDFDLASIPYLYSLIPLAQASRCPIHGLKSSDGLVGSQFSQVKDYGNVMASFCHKLLKNLGNAR